MGGALLLSFFVHIVGFIAIGALSHGNGDIQALEKLKIHVSQPKEEKPPEVIPPKPKEKPKPKPKEKIASTTPEKPKVEAKPIMGIQPDALKGAGTIAVPAGNTLMKEDDGTRVRPEVVGTFQGDLSADAKLIVTTFEKPKYTDAAIDAGLEGAFVVDVFVDENGNVKEAEVRKKIGYGMDEPVLESTRKAKFTPRKNKFGKALSGWAEIKVRLVIP